MWVFVAILSSSVPLHSTASGYSKSVRSCVIWALLKSYQGTIKFDSGCFISSWALWLRSLENMLTTLTERRPCCSSGINSCSYLELPLKMDALTLAEVMSESWLGVGKMYVSIDSKYAIQQQYSIQWFMSWLFGKSLPWIKLYSRSYWNKVTRRNRQHRLMGEDQSPQISELHKRISMDWSVTDYEILYLCFQGTLVVKEDQCLRNHLMRQNRML